MIERDGALGFRIIKTILNGQYDNYNESYKMLVNAADMVITIILILLISKIIIRITSSVIEKFFNRQKKSRFGFSERKADTLTELLKSVVRYAIYFFAIMWMFGFDSKMVVALTSIAGVAIGFGAQSFVRDVISGFFFLFEDQFSVGDYIEAEGKSGIVEALTIRVTKLRDFSGDLHIIPNGSIGKVTNKSRGNMRAQVDVLISYGEDADRAIDVIKNVGEEVEKLYKKELVDGPDVLGITALEDIGVRIRVVARTKPMKQWDVEMELRRRIKSALEREEIKTPYDGKFILNWKRGDNQ